jgi:broad specificity phosphatase PhoE
MVGAIRRAVAGAPPDGPVVVVSHGLAIQAALLRIAGPEVAMHLGNGRWVALRGQLVRA